MQSQHSVNTEFKKYQEALLQLKESITKEQICKVAFKTADNDLKLLQTQPLDPSFSGPSTDELQAAELLWAKHDAAFRSAREQLEKSKKLTQKCEQNLIQNLSEKAIQNIIGLHRQHHAAGFSKISAEVLIEMLGQINEAKSTEQISLITLSIFQILNILSINNDRLKVDAILQQIETTQHAFGKFMEQDSSKPLDEKQLATIKELKNEMEAVSKQFTSQAAFLENSLNEENNAMNESLTGLIIKLNQNLDESKNVQARLTEIAGQLKSSRVIEPERGALQIEYKKLHKTALALDNEISDLSEQIDKKREEINVIGKGIKKIKKLAKEVKSLALQPLFKAEEVTPTLLSEALTSLQTTKQNLLELALGATKQEIAEEKIQRVNQHLVLACIKHVSELCFIKYDSLMLEEQLKLESGKIFLRDVLISSLINSLGLYVNLGAPFGDFLSETYQLASSGKNTKTAYDLASHESYSDASMLEKALDFMKKNPTKTGANGAIAAASLVLLILFPPTTAFGIIAAAFSGKSMALDVKDLIEHMGKEMLKSKEIAGSLDQHSDLLKRLQKEAQDAPLENKLGLLSAFQEAALLVGSELRESPEQKPIASSDPVPKPPKTTRSLPASPEPVSLRPFFDKPPSGFISKNKSSVSEVALQDDKSLSPKKT
jgi:hypothetical protein